MLNAFIVKTNIDGDNENNYPRSYVILNVILFTLSWKF